MMQDQKQYQWEKVKTANVISVISVSAMVVIIILLFFVEVPEGNQNLLFFLLGSFSTTLIGGIVWDLYKFKKEGEKQDK